MNSNLKPERSRVVIAIAVIFASIGIVICSAILTGLIRSALG